METQATAPESSQAPEPVHAIDHENTILERLTNFVKNNPDNDPDAGTDLEGQNVRPQEADELPPPEEEDEILEIDEDTPFFELEYKTDNGKETKKLSAKELREGWLAKQDYHRNIQKVQQERQQLQQTIHQETQKAQQAYESQLAILRQAVVKTAAPELSNIDWNRLANEDPAEFVRMSARANQVNTILQGIDQEQQKASSQRAALQGQALQVAVQRAQETLSREVPNWGQELYQSLLQTGVQEYGFAPDEVSKIVDARTIKLLHDAHQYRQLQKAKPQVEKKVVTIPKVVKPGSANKPDSSSDTAGLEKRLKKTGDWRDAAALYLASKKSR